MRSLQRTMKQAQQTYQSSTQSLETAWMDLGSSLLESSASTLETIPDICAKDIETALSAQSKKKHNQSIIDDISSLIEEKQEIQSTLKEVPSRLKTTEAANTPVFKHVGEQVISLYGHRDLSSRDLSELLKPAREISHQISDINREIDQLQTAKKNFGLGSMGSGLKIAAKKSRRSSLTKYLEQEATELGRQLLSGHLLPELMDPDVETAAAGYFQNQSRIEEIKDAETELRISLDTIEERIQELCGSGNPQQQLDKLEMQNRSLQKEIETLLVRLAKKYYSSDPMQSNTAPNGVQELIERIQKLTESTQSEQQRIQRLEAAIQLKKAETRHQEIQKKLQSTDQQIRSLGQEKRRLEEELEVSESDIQRLTELRGSMQGLMEN